MVNWELKHRNFQKRVLMILLLNTDGFLLVEMSQTLDDIAGSLTKSRIAVYNLLRLLNTYCFPLYLKKSTAVSP